VGCQLILSAATAIVPFIGADGNPSTDVSRFSKVLDYIAIMNYDIWGPWTPVVGPNAPLDDSCTIPDYQIGSAVSAVDAWHSAGMPVSHIVLGVPAYGHSFSVPPADAFTDSSQTKLALYSKFDNNTHPPGDSWDDPAGVDTCGNVETAGGLWDMWAMIQAGYLNHDGTAARGFAYRYDDCSQTVSTLRNIMS